MHLFNMTVRNVHLFNMTVRNMHLFNMTDYITDLA